MKKQGFWAKLLGREATPQPVTQSAPRPPVIPTTPMQREQIRRESQAYRAERGGRGRGPVTTPTPSTTQDTNWIAPYIAMTTYDADRDTRSNGSTLNHPSSGHSGYTHHDSSPSHSSSHDHGSSFGGGGDFGGGGGGGDFGGGGF